MEYLFKHGANGEATKLTEIGEMPQNWQMVRLGEVFITQLGKMLSPKAKVGKSPKPYMRNANVQWGYVDCSEVFKMDFDERESKKFRLEHGDILVCEGGEVGRTAIWRNELPECYFQKAIHRLRPRNGQILPTFFLYHMERAFLYENIYGVAGTETTIAHLPQDKLVSMFIPKPSLEEQQVITQILKACDACILTLQREIKLLEELFRALLEELMTGRLSTLPLIDEGGDS
jgi:type I restriction enzyme S subunit